MEQKESRPPRRAYDYDGFVVACEQFAELISTRKEQLFKALRDYETHSTIEHELKSSIEALKGVRQELASYSHPRTDLTISAFFPLNLPLYSLVLYGIIPSVFSKNIFLRPPEVMRGLLPTLASILQVGTKYFPEIAIKEVPRHIFTDLFASDSDVILFTGKYKNAMDIHRECPHALLVYEGSGVCPIVLCSDANVKLAVDKAVSMRCFNSGQDCVAPDAIFVPSNLVEAFTKKLMSKLETLKVGDSRDPDVTISRIIKDSYILPLEAWLEREYRSITYGGMIDTKHSYVHPTVVSKHVKDHTGAFHEFFAPVFYILSYDSKTELNHIFDSEEFVAHSMYASVFGSDIDIEKQLSRTNILRNTIVNDIEDGNSPYGGWGSRANFLLYGDRKIIRPILITRDIQELLNN